MVINGIEVEEVTYQMLRKQLKIQGRSYHWLADNMGYGYYYVYYLLNGYKPLLEKHIQIMSELLELPLTPIKLSPIE